MPEASAIFAATVKLFLYVQIVLFNLLPFADFFKKGTGGAAELIRAVCAFWITPAAALLGGITDRHPGMTDKAVLITESVLFVIAKTLPVL